MIKHWFRKKIKLSYGITVCNEAVELERLILFLLLHKDRQDEVIVLQDITTTDRWVSDVLNAYRGELVIRTELLNGDFAGFKNKLIDVATGDYLFQIDADEMPAVDLIRKVKPILVKQRDAD
ncbi:MAG: glycosyltransferase, partial [Bacteroidetes bacterium]|nr:glycosyltransferase [Fibrella sp.]